MFLNTTTVKGERSCTVMFGKDLSSCRNLSYSLQNAANISRISVDLPISLIKLMNKNMCLVVKASDIVHTVETEKRLTVFSGIVC